MKHMIKTTTCALALLGALSGSALAGTPVTPVQGQLTTFTAAANSVNCYNHNTDICVVNNTRQTISFSIPTLNIPRTPIQNAQPGNPPTWVDAWYSTQIPYLTVNVWNQAGVLRFHNDQTPNHSIIEIDPGQNKTIKVSMLG